MRDPPGADRAQADPMLAHEPCYMGSSIASSCLHKLMFTYRLMASIIRVHILTTTDIYGHEHLGHNLSVEHFESVMNFVAQVLIII